ncbi:hypothetical protein [Pseudomonas syringae group genomosp. 3]|uniref:hypothetical protein n=1 Tax=Pseudomonas syringae group genomosp. 3 TaxID=251701 RepID=UPI001C81C1D0|nr:hypothetical protein [Pseudomonas syringae group genomosp. 3]
MIIHDQHFIHGQSIFRYSNFQSQHNNLVVYCFAWRSPLRTDSQRPFLQLQQKLPTKLGTNAYFLLIFIEPSFSESDELLLPESLTLSIATPVDHLFVTRSAPSPRVQADHAITLETSLAFVVLMTCRSAKVAYSQRY